MINEGDLKHVEALMSKRDHGSLMSLPSERLLLYAELADEVPGLVAEVRRLSLQIEPMRNALKKIAEMPTAPREWNQSVKAMKEVAKAVLGAALKREGDA